MGRLFTLLVDGETFDVVEDSVHPGSVHFTWLSGPNPGYGFASGLSAGGLPDRTAAEREIRLFLAAVDPRTGYLG
jgi:hypothetical protein